MTEKESMNNRVVFSIIGCMVLASPLLADMSYVGSLSTDAGTIVAGDGWNYPGTSIAWEVTVGSSSVHYKYTFTVPTEPQAKDISHLILEVTKVADVIGPFDVYNTRDFRGFESGQADLPVQSQQYYEWTDGNSNPDMPDAGLFGIKFNQITDATEWVIEFDSDRLPMWGDFYAKDGQSGGIWATAWNSQFGLAVDADYWATDVVGKLLVPDGAVVPLPGAVLLGMFGLSYAGMKLRKHV